MRHTVVLTLCCPRYHLQIAQTPALESANPLEKHNIPSEARQQQIVGQTGTGCVRGDQGCASRVQ